jgi:hypothetical protein
VATSSRLERWSLTHRHSGLRKSPDFLDADLALRLARRLLIVLVTKAVRGAVPQLAGAT